MPPVNPRAPPPYGQPWPSDALDPATGRPVTTTADPRMQIQSPDTTSAMPNAMHTPMAPEVWAAAFNSQAPPATAPLWSWEALNAARQPVGNIDPRMVVPVPTDQGYIRPAQINPPPPEAMMANAPQNPLLQQMLLHILRTGRAI
jgi:hypothetical protein